MNIGIPDDEYQILPDDVSNKLGEFVARAASDLGINPGNTRQIKILAELSDNVAQYVAWRARKIFNETDGASASIGPPASA
jgi:hypothetical protein